MKTAIEQLYSVTAAVKVFEIIMWVFTCHAGQICDSYDDNTIHSTYMAQSP